MAPRCRDALVPIVAIFVGSCAPPQPGAPAPAPAPKPAGTAVAPSPRAAPRPCPIPLTPAAPPSLEGPPTYDEAAWLADSLRVADVVVEGTPSSHLLRAESVLCGRAHPSLDSRELALDGPPLPARAGIWLLVRTPRGYRATHPEPLDRAGFEALTAGASPADPRPTIERQPSDRQRYHVLADQPDTWHGTHVSLEGHVVSVELYEEGRRVFGRRWGPKGLERVYHLPAKGYGFELAVDRDLPLAFAHYRDGAKNGVSRAFFRGTRDLQEESRWHDGLRHGRARIVERPGAVARDEEWVDGLLAPVVRYTGQERSDATIHKSADGVTYAAPRELVHRFRVGMTTAQVAEILRLAFSPAMGIVFAGYDCERDYRIEFGGGRVTKVGPVVIGRHCQ